MEKEILKAGYMNQKEARKKLKKDLGWKMDKSLSTNETKVFVDKEKTPHIIHRGTRRVSDWGTNLNLALGLEKYDARFKEGKRITQLVEQKYNKLSNSYGDSLGGALAEKSGSGGSIYTHNKATGFLDIGKTIPKRQKDERNINDAVSLLSLTQNHKYNNLVENNTGESPTNILANHKII